MLVRYLGLECSFHSTPGAESSDQRLRDEGSKWLVQRCVSRLQATPTSPQQIHLPSVSCPSTPHTQLERFFFFLDKSRFISVSSPETPAPARDPSEFSVCGGWGGLLLKDKLLGQGTRVCSVFWGPWSSSV